MDIVVGSGPRLPDHAHKPCQARCQPGDQASAGTANGDPSAVREFLELEDRQQGTSNLLGQVGLANL
eukprot:6539107-Alexandrium_andersonii.AAC.1